VFREILSPDNLSPVKYFKLAHRAGGCAIGGAQATANLIARTVFGSTSPAAEETGSYHEVVPNRRDSASSNQQDSDGQTGLYVVSEDLEARVLTPQPTPSRR